MSAWNISGSSPPGGTCVKHLDPLSNISFSDGDECESAILQTGLDFTVSNGEVSYDSWYEWYPDYAYDFSGITFSAGDSGKPAFLNMLARVILL